jgi:hypothetical protein
LALALGGCQTTDLNWFKPQMQGHPKLDYALNQLILAYESGGIDGAAAFARQHGIQVTDNKTRVIIEAQPTKQGEVTDITESLGGDVEASHENLIQALVPITQLKALADNASVKLVRLPFEATPPAIPNNK